MTVQWIVPDLVTIIASGGSFHVAPRSRVLAIYSGFSRLHTDDTRAFTSIARRVGINAILVPENIDGPGFFAMMHVVIAFLKTAPRPAAVITVIVVPDCYISDETVYVAKNHVIDGGKILDAMLSKKRPWLLVKNDGGSNDVLVERVQKSIPLPFQEKLFSSAIVLSKLGFKNFKDLVTGMETGTIMA